MPTSRPKIYEGVEISEWFTTTHLVLRTNFSYRELNVTVLLEITESPINDSTYRASDTGSVRHQTTVYSIRRLG